MIYRYIVMIVLFTFATDANSNMQKGVYDAADEMIRFDEKMNQAIIKHNQLDAEDEEEMRLNAMVEDFEEIEGGYLLERDIPENNSTKVDVKLEDGMLRITITTKEEEVDNKFSSSFETVMSSTSISLSIPNDADENMMEKSYNKGILKVKFPKK